MNDPSLSPGQRVRECRFENGKMERGFFFDGYDIIMINYFPGPVRSFVKLCYITPAGLGSVWPRGRANLC